MGVKPFTGTFSKVFLHNFILPTICRHLRSHELTWIRKVNREQEAPLPPLDWNCSELVIFSEFQLCGNMNTNEFNAYIYTDIDMGIVNRKILQNIFL